MEYGELVFDQSSSKVDARRSCVVGHIAHMDRVTTPSARGRQGQGRPLGFLTTWLLAGKEHTSKESHQSFTAMLGSGRGYDKRVVGLTFLDWLEESVPEVSELFARERDATEAGGRPHAFANDTCMHRDA